MSSVTNRTALITGASRDLVQTTAQGLANEFAYVIVLGDITAGSCRTGGGSSGPGRTDTNGKPLRDWDD